MLRHGFKFYGKGFRLAYFKPAHGANYETANLFAKNRLTVTRQVPCHPNDNRTLDMVLPVSTSTRCGRRSRRDSSSMW